MAKWRDAIHDWFGLRGPGADRHAMFGVIEASLLARPEEWAVGDYTAINEKRQLCIWIANKDYALKVSDGIDWRRNQLPITAAWRRRLWRAFKQMRPRAARDDTPYRIVSRFRDRPQLRVVGHG